MLLLNVLSRAVTFVRTFVRISENVMVLDDIRSGINGYLIDCGEFEPHVGRPVLRKTSRTRITLDFGLYIW